MNIKEILEDIDLKIDKSKISYDEPMAKHTSFKAGGVAECYIKIDNIDDLREILNIAKKNNIKLFRFFPKEYIFGSLIKIKEKLV